MWTDRFLQLPMRTVVVALFAVIFCPVAARCEVSVRGTEAALRIDAHQATLSEVLSTLGANFKVRHDTLIPLDEVTVSGTYSGTLEEVLKRVLAGLNYVIQTQEGAVEVFVVGRPETVVVPRTTSPEPPRNTNPAAQWRKTTVPEQQP
jgi:hypothetical protein